MEVDFVFFGFNVKFCLDCFAHSKRCVKTNSYLPLQLKIPAEASNLGREGCPALSPPMISQRLSGT
jgi:hypothetical protein